MSVSADVRRSPCRDEAIVTQLVTRLSGRGGGWPPCGYPVAARPSPRRPCTSHEKKEYPDNSAQTFIGIAADREESNAAGTDADGDTLQQRAKVVSFG